MANKDYGEDLPAECPPAGLPEDALTDVFRLIAKSSPDEECFASRGSYNALYQFLSFSGLLKTQDDRSAFVSDVTRETIVTLASKLDTYMPGVSFQSFMDMAGQSEVVAAKVLMSVYRRMVRLYKFFEEGRVAYEGLDTTPQADSDDA